MVDCCFANWLKRHLQIMSVIWMTLYVIGIMLVIFSYIKVIGWPGLISFIWDLLVVAALSTIPPFWYLFIKTQTEQWGDEYD